MNKNNILKNPYDKKKLEDKNKKMVLNNTALDFNLLNTNVRDYTIDDIFNLLDIEISQDKEYETIIEELNEKINKNVDFFEKLKNEKMVDFFNDVRDSLLGKKSDDTTNKSEAESLLIQYSKMFDAEKNRGIKSNQSDTTDKKLYDSNSGAGNPINRKTISKLLNIDSRFRNNYDTSKPTDYKIELPYIIQNVIEMKLSDVEFPSTYYPFNDEYENNYFWIKITAGNGSLTYVYIYIEPGNYYHSSLIQKIQNTLNDLGLDLIIHFNLNYENSGGVGVGDGLVDIGASPSNITGITEVELNFKGKKLLSSVENYNVSQKFLIDLESQERIINDYYYQDSIIDYKQRFGWMLGYRNPVYNNKIKHYSEAILDVLGAKYLYLIVDDFNNSKNVNFLNSSEKTMLNDNIIARISIKGFAFSIQSQTDLSIFSEPRYFYGPVNITKLEVKVVDEYGRLVDLNNMDFSFTLNCICIYSQE